MELSSLEPSRDTVAERRCALCGAHTGTELLCQGCLERGLDSQQYSRLFWDEA